MMSHTVNPLSVAEILSLIGGRRPSDAETHSTRSPATIWVDKLPGIFPNFVLRGPVEALLSLSTTASVAAPNCFPISSFAHLFDEDAFGQSFEPLSGGLPQDDYLARLGSYLAIGELFAYLNEGRPAPPSAIATQYSRTLAYALSRANIIHPALDSTLVFQRWSEVRRLTGWESNELLLPPKLFKCLTRWLNDKNEFSWADQLFGSMSPTADPDFAPLAARIVSETFGLSLSTLPPSFDARFEWLSIAVNRLRATSSKTDEIEFALGLLLAALEPGELMHLNWLRLQLSQYPLAAIHYAGWSAKLSSRRYDRTDIFNGLTRRLMRELLRPFRLEDPPIEDLSWIDLIAGADLIDETRVRANTRNFTVSLVPGVIIGCSLHKVTEGTVVETKRSVPPTKQVAGKTTAAPVQKALFDPKTTPKIEDRLDEIFEQLFALTHSVTQLKNEKKAPRKVKEK